MKKFSVILFAGLCLMGCNSATTVQQQPATNGEVLAFQLDELNVTWIQDNVGFARKLCKQILTEVLPYMNIYMTEELTEKEEAELAELNITIKKAAQPEEEEQPEVTDAPDVDEEGNIDPHGGDVTSSNQVTEEEMNSDDVELAPLTGNVLNVETGEAVRENTDEVPY